MADQTAVENPVRLAREYAWLMNIAATDQSMADLMKRLEAYIKKVKGDRTSITTWVETNLPKTAWAQARTSARQQGEIEANDPRFREDFDQSIATKRRALEVAAQNMGAVLDPDELDFLAREARLSGWDEQQTFDQLSKYVNAVDGDFKGQAGSVQDELASWADINGVRMSPGLVAQYVQRVSRGETTLDEVKSDIRKTYMAGTFPAWADKINAGMDIADIAAPYKNALASLLEVDPNTVGFNDKALTAALQSTDKDGKPRMMPLFEFENMVRKDPRWQTTDNAYQTYSGVAQGILRTFGFA